MATTGAKLYTLFGEAVDKDYTEYINPDRFNRVMENAFINLADIVYRQKDTQKEHDELSELSVIDRVLSINNNRFYVRPLQIESIVITGLQLEITFDDHNVEAGDQVSFDGVQGITTVPDINGQHTVTSVGSGTITITFGIAPVGVYVAQTGRMTNVKMITDYYHIFAMKCRFVESSSIAPIYKLTGSSPIVIEFLKKNLLRTAQQAIISGVVGTTSANGIHYLKQTGRHVFELYQDERLLLPVAGNAAYISGGSVQEVVYRYADRLSSDQKYSESDKADIKEPKYIEDRSTFKVYPSLYKCDEVTVDYLRRPSVEIDGDNDVLDLENYYTKKLLYRLKDDAAIRFFDQIHEFKRSGAMRELTMTNK